MDLNLKSYLSKFSIFAISLIILHLLFLRAIPLKLGVSINNIIEIYAFILLLNIAHFFALRWLFSKWPKYAGFMFTGLSLFKMAVAVIFLLPYIFPKTQASIAFTLNFMCVYMLTLVFEVVFIAKNMVKVKNI